MKPVKLVMSAFGPYAKEEVIDFSLLNGKNIFLITGPTGAGKTTIFDAISYALFGEASGSSRENESLRSDFADAKRLTYVELDFELKGELYHIRRVPQQMKPKVKGDGFTHQGSEAELVLPDGKVRTGTGNVTNKINELLGINKEQFKQIVMLPQGEFKKLLLADSKEREVIFRKIFGTYNYEKIQLLLNERAKGLYKDLEKSRDRIIVNLKNIKSEDTIVDDENIDFLSVVDKIEKDINTRKIENKEVQDKLTLIRKSIEKSQEEKIKGININNLIEEKMKAQAILEEYKSREKEIQDQENRLIKINKAKEILYIEEELLRLEKGKENKEKSNTEVAENIDVLRKKLEEAKIDLEKNEAKESEKNKLIEFVNSLNEKKPKIIEFDNKQSSVKKLTIEINNLKECISKEQNRLESLKENELKSEQDIKNISDLEKQKIILDKEAEDKEKLIEEVRNLYKAIRRLKEYKVTYDKAKDEFSSKELIYKKSKSYFEDQQELYMKEQAGILASTLIKGEPCPVCGSIEHPKPAARMTKVPTEEELKKIQSKYEKDQQEYNELLIHMAKIKSSMESLMEDVINKKIVEISVNTDLNVYNENSEEEVLDLGKKIGTEIKELSIKIDNLNKEVCKKDEVNKSIEIIKDSINKSEVKITELNNTYTNEFALLKADEEKVKSLEDEIPKDINSIEQLEKEISKIQKQIEIYNKSIKDARDIVNMLANKVSSEDAKYNEGKKIISEFYIEIKEKKDLFNERIRENNFIDYDEYNDVKKYISKIEEIQSKVTDFKEKFKSISDRNNDLSEKTKGLVTIDINSIEERIVSQRKEEAEVNQKAKELYSVITNNSNILTEVKNINEKIKEKEEKYRIIGELANLANGKKSPYISFERFVLASYFQEIIDAANTRLAKMTGERFRLKRKEDKGKGTAQQGLELEVFDNYTGKCRHVKTLSGGESFKASLSLALGLSDVVQANAGGISLDTIFIDEGFGTLDSESLDNAINSLIELQRGGRLVGIISHVPELKERIEAKLEIKASIEGSSARFDFN